MSKTTKGELVIVGFGIQLGRHLTERSISEIACADLVVCLVDPIALAYLKQLRPDVVSLHTTYGPGKDRRITYKEMEAAMVEPVRGGKKVCAVYYGHPGVFADAPHRAIATLREEGFNARMEAGISAEACLYADLNMDPGKRGMMSMEATQFLIFNRVIDPTAMIILWQVGIVGDTTCTQLFTTEERLQLLVSKLLRWYSPEHEVVLYEAAQVAIQPIRSDRILLKDLPKAKTSQITTLVIPPAIDLGPDHATLSALGVTWESLF